MYPWIWLNEPQHSSAVQAVAAVVATCAAFIVAIFAVLAFIWERKQVSEAHAQTEFVTAQAAASAEQTRIAREQADIAQKAFSEEREQRNVEWTEEVISVYRPYDLEPLEAFGDPDCLPEME